MDPILYQHLFYLILSAPFTLMTPWLLSVYNNIRTCIYPRFAAYSTYLLSTAPQRTGFDFSAFFTEYSRLYPKLRLPTVAELEWLIGFAEGDGSFIVATRGDISFVLTQSTDDLLPLLRAQSILGFGSVIGQSTSNNTSRFVVQSTNNLHLIARMFNGNIVFPTHLTRFLNWLSAVNKRLQTPVVPVTSTTLPLLHGCHWVAGFTDAEGCFTISLLANSIAFRIRFILPQSKVANQAVLKYLGELFGVGRVEPHSIADNWGLIINGLRNQAAVVNYFNAHPLYTKKAESFLVYKELMAGFAAKDHMDPVLRAKMSLLAAQVNPGSKGRGRN